MKPALMPSSYRPHVGGVEGVTERLAKELASAGDEPIVVTNRWPKTLPHRERADGIPVVRYVFRVPERTTRQMVGWAASAAATGIGLRRTLSRHGADVVNVHCVSSNARYALHAAQRLRLPLIVSLHGELTGDATGLFTRSALMREVLADVLRAAAAVTAPSHHTLNEACRWLDEDMSGRAVVIPNGVDCPPPEGDRTERVPIVIAAGRLVSVKGFDVLIRAFATAFGGSEYLLVIAGDGPERQSLVALAEELGVGAQTRLPGFVSRSELQEQFSTAQIAVVPSRAEAQGLSMLEAMSAGSAVVASRVGGIPEVADDGQNALLVPPDDVAALAHALRDLASSQQLRQALGTAAHARALTFDWATTIAKYRELYAQVAQ